MSYRLLYRLLPLLLAFTAQTQASTASLDIEDAPGISQAPTALLSNQYLDDDVLINPVSPNESFFEPGAPTVLSATGFYTTSLGNHDLSGTLLSSSNVQLLSATRLDGTPTVINTTTVAPKEETNVVPIPAALWLFASGIAGLMGFAARGRRRS